MKSWMMSFVGGVMLLHWYGHVLPEWVIWLTPLPIFLLPLSLNLRWVFTAILAGCVWANAVALSHEQNRLPEAAEGAVFRVQGFLCNIPRLQGDHFIVEVCLSDQSTRTLESGIPFTLNAGTRLRLSYYPIYSNKADYSRNAAQDSLFRTMAFPASGYYEVTLKRPHGLANPWAVDSDRLLYRSGIVAAGSINAVLTPVDSLLVDCSLFCRYWEWRLTLVSKLTRQTHWFSEAGLMHALVLGDRTLIDSADRDLFSATGTQHLIAISGMHVGLIAFYGWCLGRAILFIVFRIFPSGVYQSKIYARLVLLIPIALSLFASLSYGLAAGLSISTFRAVLMIFMVWGSHAWRARIPLFTIWVVALFISVVWDPACVLDAGFWLSFGAVGLLMLGLQWRLTGYSGLAGLLRAQWVVFLGLLPFLGALGLPVSLTGWGANIGAIPLISMVTVPLAMLGVLLASVCESAAFIAFEIVNDSLILCRYWLELWRFDSLLVFPESMHGLEGGAVMMLSIFFGWLCLVGRLRSIGTWWAACWMLLLVFMCRPWPVPVVEIVVFDVGQGLSIVLLVENKLFIYDTGYGNGDYAVFQRSVMPWLAHKGNPALSELMLSHGDQDHAGGARYVIEHLKPDLIVSGEPQRIGFPEVQQCVPGQRWAIDSSLDVSVTTLSSDVNASNGNDHSCVVKIRVNAWSMLVTGDLSSQGEHQLVRSVSDNSLESDVFIAGHHGSKSSNSSALLNRVKPEMVIFSAGYRSRFGHPHPQVVARMNAIRARTYNTAESGAVSFIWQAGEQMRPSVVIQRGESLPFWRKI
ncbi:MAG: DNA internalization-related competence protein ComEC/Rec2 [Hahellaceae bacterium]|nr:DNA internalization-related competence protein ComEC/Rec2 [Hahellaceae bacterium]